MTTDLENSKGSSLHLKQKRLMNTNKLTYFNLASTKHSTEFQPSELRKRPHRSFQGSHARLKTDSVSEKIALPQPPIQRRMFNSQLMGWDQVLQTLFTKQKNKKRIIQEKTNHKAYAKQIESEILCREIPFPILNRLSQSKSSKSQFSRYLDGKISPIELVEQINYSATKEAQTSIQRTSFSTQKLFNSPIIKQRGKHFTYVEQLNAQTVEMNKGLKAQTNIQKIRNLIISKVNEKEENGDYERTQTKQNLIIFKQMYSATDKWLERLQNEENLVINNKCKSLNTLKVIYSHQTAQNNLSNRSGNIEIPMDKKVIKKLINDKCEEFLRKQSKDYGLKENQQKDQIYKQLQRERKDKFRIEYKDNYFLPDPSKKKKEFLLKKDVDLFRYLSHPSPLLKQSQTLIKVSDLTNLQTDRTETLIKIKQKKPFLTHRTDNSVGHSDESGNSSLQSVFEINVDELYNRSLGLQSRLKKHRFKEGSCNAIKEIQKLQAIQVQQYLEKIRVIAKSNVQKLAGARFTKINVKD